MEKIVTVANQILHIWECETLNRKHTVQSACIQFVRELQLLDSQFKRNHSLAGVILLNLIRSMLKYFVLQ